MSGLAARSGNETTFYQHLLILTPLSTLSVQCWLTKAVSSAVPVSVEEEKACGETESPRRCFDLVTLFDLSVPKHTRLTGYFPKVAIDLNQDRNGWEIGMIGLIALK